MAGEMVTDSEDGIKWPAHAGLNGLVYPANGIGLEVTSFTRGYVQTLQSEFKILQTQLELAVKALREVVNEHENHAPAERKMHEIAQQTLKQLGITL